MVSFDKLLCDYIKDSAKRFQGKLLCFDPGETTGVALFDARERVILEKWDQIKCNPLEVGIHNLSAYIDAWKPDRLVYEDYKVYSWKSASHSWASLHTPQLIGAIRTICQVRKIPYSCNMAVEAKGFFPNEKLQEFGFDAKGKKHARDAIRHGLFYLMFRHKI